YKGALNSVSSVSFSPDGKYIASGSGDRYGVWVSGDSTIKLWEVSTGKLVRTFEGHNTVLSVAFSPDGKYIASGSSDKTIKLWEVSTGEHVRTFDGHKSWVSSVCFSSDGKYIASGSGDGTIRLWYVKFGKEVAQFIFFSDGEWVVITSEGYYNASANGEKYLNVRVGNEVYGVEKYRDMFYRPDLVKHALEGN
ncbi:MAG TPA: WD40 repeat domain-containing protein, partial [Candidatus Hydrothermia bacterium]|nr:WD40 repeat domain-containing protein [Candidatus Hydrothermia bacterium]